MKTWWVSFVKYAGVSVQADTEEEAEAKGLQVPESEYEYDQINEDEWELNAVTEYED
jgi:predicted RNase H-like HicB family nuclease